VWTGAEQQYADDGYALAIHESGICKKDAEQAVEQAQIKTVQCDEQQVPRPWVDAEPLVKNVSGELGELVQAFGMEVGAVDVLVKAIVLHLVEPAGKVADEAGLCGRQVQHESKQPDSYEQQDRVLLRVFVLYLEFYGAVQKCNGFGTNINNRRC